ncbi:MAG: DUF3408 domain-containing protein [Bacteroidales bacterium]|jgi:hypothetical protein|nr:DUF3408 domain-containing protein [Bacteroidales bacterium]
MAKKSALLDEDVVLARMAAGSTGSVDNNELNLKVVSAPKNNDNPEKERRIIEEPLLKETHNGNGKRGIYEEKFLRRNIYGASRGNVGISRETLDIAERVVVRIFDNKIAVGAYVDNILWEHFNKYKKDYELWLSEKPTAIF